MALTTIDNFLAETQVAINALNSDNQAEKDAITAKINLIIKAASNEVIHILGWDPIQSEDKTEKYELTSLTKFLMLKEPVRTTTTIKINGATIDAVIQTKFTIQTPFYATAGSSIEIAGRFGLYDDVAAMEGTPLQSACNALVYQRLFKFGTITARNQGSDSSNYRGDSWLNRSAVDNNLLAFQKWSNLR